MRYRVSVLLLFVQLVYLYATQLRRIALSLRPFQQQASFDHSICGCCQETQIWWTKHSQSSDGNSLKRFMLDSIKWYRKSLSPIMPPNCRFFPSCSNYGIDAIEQFGPWKGGFLTAWRIFRCNPFGGSGYDPPKWPPPNFFSGSNSRIKF
mmetsp:Transcript_3880/g.5335  ORF Transcript_3880/g.5335 Transcript_3880/m.5335 type:complete len:150 (+) Transcript_3880:1-450(+)